MSNTQSSKATIDAKLEVVPLPVTDVDRAKSFYEGLGWRVDADFAAGDSWRVVQLTPPGSPCSIFIGKGLTKVAPGSAQGLCLIVDDIAQTRADLVARGVDVSEVFHFDGPLHFTGKQGRAAGPDPQGRSYKSWVSFNDPDGNGWMVQEVKARLPGRGFSTLDVPTLTELLREAEKLHGEYTAAAPKHHWSGWYAAYIVARERGSEPKDAAKEAAAHMSAEAARG
jgi:catechol 2,3-dioxygenase-like lactoylglutathione lyase family enzyme